jgi:hypothetical protein
VISILSQFIIVLLYCPSNIQIVLYFLISPLILTSSLPISVSLYTILNERYLSPAVTSLANLSAVERYLYVDETGVTRLTPLPSTLMSHKEAFRGVAPSLIPFNMAFYR